MSSLETGGGCYWRGANLYRELGQELMDQTLQTKNARPGAALFKLRAPFVVAHVLETDSLTPKKIPSQLFFLLLSNANSKSVHKHCDLHMHGYESPLWHLPNCNSLWFVSNIWPSCQLMCLIGGVWKRYYKCMRVEWDCPMYSVIRESFSFPSNFFLLCWLQWAYCSCRMSVLFVKTGWPGVWWL